MERNAKRETGASNRNGHQVPNLLRGLAVLELLGEHNAGLIASDIARMLDAPKNSTGRVLAAMTAFPEESTAIARA